ncbi:MAG: serine hydrolase domain-containing protein [Chloroflexota bacterium]
MTKILSAAVLSFLLTIAMMACTDNLATETLTEQPVQLTSNVDTQVVLDNEQLAEFVNLIEQTRLEYDIPGVAAAIVSDDQIVFAEGFGVRDVHGNEVITPETLFHIGSTHKSITALLIATLVDDGVLDWDTPVVEIYPDFALSDPESTRQVTLRHLLSMSSGIPAAAEDEFDIETASAEDMFTLLSEITISHQPGEQFSYSNISTSVAGYIGVLADGGEMELLYDGYAQLLQDRIFDPIGMQTATLSVEEAHANPNHSASHVFDEDGAIIVVESYDFTGDPLAPSGSIKASVLDMANYMSTQVSRGVAPDGTWVVSEENLTETWRPQIEDEESGGSYGLGWGIQTQDDVEVISHEGSYDNFSALLIFVPETNTGMVLLTNLDDPGNFMEIVSEQFVQLVIEEEN